MLARTLTEKSNKINKCAPPHNYYSSSRYSQQYQFDDKGLGNMTLKASSTDTSGGKVVGGMLDYRQEYEYEKGYAHRALRIGERHYRYDANGNVTEEQDGPFEEATEKGASTIYETGDGAYYATAGSTAGTSGTC